jgi:acyl-CoA synthetase (AMP-forming)/AMP-acid ligase II
VARIVPDYAVPADLLLVERLPLNSNGKVDYRALGHDPRLSAASRPSTSPIRELAG